MLGDLGIGAILADDMGLGKTVQAIAMLVSEREEAWGGGVRADARRVPDERGAAVGGGGASLRAGPARASASRERPARERGAAPQGERGRRDRHVVRHRDARRRGARGRRLGPADHGRGAGCEEPADEARAGVADAAGAAARRDDGHADREPAERAVGDHGHPQSGAARLARVVQPGDRAADRGGEGRGGAGAAAGGGAAVHPAAGEGRAGGRARPAADHGREGLLQADDRAGEPLPGDG